MKFFKKPLSVICLFLLCITQAGCSLIELPFDLLGSAVSTAVSAGLAYGPSVAPFFM
jgi:hypothetical protein